MAQESLLWLLLLMGATGTKTGHSGAAPSKAAILIASLTLLHLVQYATHAEAEGAIAGLGNSTLCGKPLKSLLGNASI